MPFPGQATILDLAGPGMLAATGPESIGYIIIAIGIVGLGLGLVVLTVVTRRRQHHR